MNEKQLIAAQRTVELCSGHPAITNPNAPKTAVNGAVIAAYVAALEVVTDYLKTRTPVTTPTS
jgi:hypothetical protein